MGQAAPAGEANSDVEGDFGRVRAAGRHVRARPGSLGSEEGGMRSSIAGASMSHPVSVRSERGVSDKMVWVNCEVDSPHHVEASSDLYRFSADWRLCVDNVREGESDDRCALERLRRFAMSGSLLLC